MRSNGEQRQSSYHNYHHPNNVGGSHTRVKWSLRLPWYCNAFSIVKLTTELQVSAEHGRSYGDWSTLRHEDITGRKWKCDDRKQKRLVYPSLEVHGEPVRNEYSLRPPFDLLLVIALLKVFNLGSLHRHTHRTASASFTLTLHEQLPARSAMCRTICIKISGIHALRLISYTDKAADQCPVFPLKLCCYGRKEILLRLVSFICAKMVM